VISTSKMYTIRIVVALLVMYCRAAKISRRLGNSYKLLSKGLLL
jgi:hypothetical protein